MLSGGCYCYCYYYLVEEQLWAVLWHVPTGPTHGGVLAASQENERICPSIHQGPRCSLKSPHDQTSAPAGTQRVWCGPPVPSPQLRPFRSTPTDCPGEETTVLFGGWVYAVTLEAFSVIITLGISVTVNEASTATRLRHL